MKAKWKSSQRRNLFKWYIAYKGVYKKTLYLKIVSALCIVIIIGV